MFGEPDEVSGSGQNLKPAEVLGHLLLIWVTEYVAYSPTKHTKEGQRADLVVVDAVDLDQKNPDTGEEGLVSRKNWWRPGPLVDAFRGRVGIKDPMLGRLSRDLGKQGIPPYAFTSATGSREDVARATAWIQAHPNFGISTGGGGPRPQDGAEERRPERGQSDLERLARQRLGQQVEDNRSRDRDRESRYRDEYYRDTERERDLPPRRPNPYPDEAPF